MASVTGKTSLKIDDLINATVVDGHIDGSGQLILETRGGAEIITGVVIDPDPLTILDVYPVGSVYFSDNNTNPGTFFGGTWIAWGTGRMPVGVDPGQTEFDTVEKTGGSKTHTLTASEMPTHTHAIDHNHASFTTASGGVHGHSTRSSVTDGGSTLAFRRSDNTSVATGGGMVETTNSAHTHDIDVPAFTGDSGSAGSGNPHNNLPPYIAIYMWKRTA